MNIGKLVSFISSSIVLFLIVILSVRVITSKERLLTFSSLYLQSNPFRIEYDLYLEHGFTEEMFDSFVTHDGFRGLYTRVMSDTISVLLYQTQPVYTEELCENELRSVLKDVIERYQVNVSDSSISVLAKYSMDVSGLSALLSIQRGEVSYMSSYDSVPVILRGLSVLISNTAIVCLFVIFFICTLLLFVLVPEHQLIHIAVSVLIPASSCFLFCVGQLCFFEQVKTLQSYLFGRVISFSLIFVVVSFGIFILDIWHQNHKRKKEKYSKEFFENDAKMSRDLVNKLFP